MREIELRERGRGQILSPPPPQLLIELFFVSGCVGDWSLGSGKQEKWTLVINRIRRSVWADAI